MIPYEKVMTRDAPLCLIEVWWRSFTESIPRATGVAWPEPVFRYKNGVVESWRASERFHHIVPKRLAQKLADSQGARRHLLAAIRDYQRCAVAIRRLSVGNAPRAVRTLSTVIDFFMRGAAGLIPAYWCAEWDARERSAGHGALFSKRILSVAQKVRKHDTFFDDAVNKAYACLDRIARARRLSRRALDVMLLDEILRDVVPSAQELKRRQAGYLYAGGKVWTGKATTAVLAKRGYVLREVMHGKENVIRGAVAFQGVARGRVAACLSPKDIWKVRRGDILIAAMTTPRYLPAMEKAAAFVTDEGGILCHAAIVSREMKKPCVIGTKIATEVLRDGDVVEVNANHGVVKVLKHT